MRLPLFLTAGFAAVFAAAAPSIAQETRQRDATLSPQATRAITAATNTPGLLSRAFPDAASIRAVLTPRPKWQPFPLLDDRAAWARADAAILKACTEAAEAELKADYNWQSPSATLALLISRTGNRSQYQAVSYKKRTVLANMIIAEIAENKGRYTDAIINGVWSICEESWWGSSAHLPHEYKGLMDVTRPRVDLYAAVTAGVLAWADYFLGEKFDAASPQIRKRIRHEVRTRVLEPVMKYPHWWMASDPSTGERPNNWNPWICSNWLTCALLLEDDEDARAAHVARILQVLDNFLTPYPADGGCDEGPGYWGSSTGSLYDNLAMLNLATNGAFRFAFQDAKIKNMARYVVSAQISPHYSVNFADAPPHARPDPFTAHRFATDIGDEAMQRLAAAGYSPQHYSTQRVRTHYAHDFFNLFHSAELAKTTPGFLFAKEIWLPDLQVAIARENDGDTRGFYFAAKGGTNNESHNHNDIGNVIVYYDGLPVLIDVGSGRYTAKTFGAERYKIWNLRSDHHNTVTINGVVQSVGRKYRATNALFEPDAATTKFSLDIAKAYPASAGVKQWRRTITLLRGKGADSGSVLIRDDASLAKTDSVTAHFMTCLSAEVISPGKILLKGKDAKNAPAEFLLEYDAERVRAEVQKIPLVTESDTGVQAAWGDNIRRINLHVAAPHATDSFEWRIRRR